MLDLAEVVDVGAPVSMDLHSWFRNVESDGTWNTSGDELERMRLHEMALWIYDVNDQALFLMIQATTRRCPAIARVQICKRTT